MSPSWRARARPTGVMPRSAAPPPGLSAGTPPLGDLSDCCCFRFLPQLGELVDQLLFERQVAQPPLPLDPEILEMLPY